MSDPEQPTLDGLREYFTHRLPERMAELREACRAARESRFSPDTLRDFHRLAHSLAGAGGTFGHPHVSAAAREVERLLNGFLKRGTPPDADEDRELDARLARLLAASGI